MSNKNLETIPNTPLLSEIFPHTLQTWPSNVHFKGWKGPQKKWKEWIDRLAGKYAAVWNQTGICDAIMSSIYALPANRSLVLGLSEFWCPETNTFVFPWGEATVTLEDVMVLAGLSVAGEPIGNPLNEDMKKLVQEMEIERNQICKSKSRKASHYVWITRFMDETDNNLEHVGFLSLWLSRFVFPSQSEETIGRHIFPIAVRLSQGKKVALGPTVLSRIYHDLGMIKVGILGSKEVISVTGTFQLLQIWAFERFPLLGPKTPNTLKCGEPRVARWHKLASKFTDLPLVRSVLRMEQNFQWRPYAANLKNWRHLSFYSEFEQNLCDDSGLDLDLRSFYRCLNDRELVGIDCVEKYFPYRVARQFGLDQDIPSYFKLSSLEHGFSVPARTYRPRVTGRYAIWWKNMMVTRETKIKVVLTEKRYTKIIKWLYPMEAKVGAKDFHDSGTLSRACEKVKTDGDPRENLSKVSSSTESKRSIAKSQDKVKVNALSNSSDDDDLPISARLKFLNRSANDDYLPISARLKFLTRSANIENSSSNLSPMNIEGVSELKLISKSEFIESKISPLAAQENIKESSATTKSRFQKGPTTPFLDSRKSIPGVTKEPISPISRNNSMQKKLSNDDKMFVVTKRVIYSCERKNNIGSYKRSTCNLPELHQEKCNTQKPLKETKGNSQNSSKKTEGDLQKIWDLSDDYVFSKKRVRSYYCIPKGNTGSYERSTLNLSENHEKNRNITKPFEETKGNPQNSFKKREWDLTTDDDFVINKRSSCVLKGNIGSYERSTLNLPKNHEEICTIQEPFKETKRNSQSSFKEAQLDLHNVKYQKKVDSEVKKTVNGDFHRDPLDFIVLSERMKQLRSGKNSVKCASTGELKGMVGDGFRRAIGSYVAQRKDQTAQGDIKTAKCASIEKTNIKTASGKPNNKTVSGKLQIKTDSGTGKGNDVMKETGSQFQELDLEGKVQMMGNLFGLC